MLPKDDSDDVYQALMGYVNDKVPWACMPFPGGGSVSYVILKPHPKSMVGMILKEIARRAVTAATKEQKILNPDEEMTIQTMIGMFQKFGKEYPMCAIGPIDGDMKIATGFVVHYNGSVALDYADPEFFDQLDQVLEHVVSHDGLSGFSLRPRSGASSNPHSSA